MPLVMQESDLILAESGPCNAGLSTLLKLGTGNGTTQKFWIASCIVVGVGLVADRNHATQSALRYLDYDTFYRLVPEHAKPLTAVDSATLMLDWPSFLSFQHMPTIRIPTSLQQFVTAASNDIALQLGVPDSFDTHMSSIIEHIDPSPTFLRRLTGNFQARDVPTVVAGLKTFFLLDSLSNKPNSVPMLRAVHLSSFDEHSEQDRAPHTNGPRDVPRCGALSLLQKTLKDSI